MGVVAKDHLFFQKYIPDRIFVNIVLLSFGESIVFKTRFESGSENTVGSRFGFEIRLGVASREDDSRLDSG